MAEVGDVVDDQDLGTGFDNHTFYRVAEREFEGSILREVGMGVQILAEIVLGFRLLVLKG